MMSVFSHLRIFLRLFLARVAVFIMLSDRRSSFCAYVLSEGKDCQEDHVDRGGDVMADVSSFGVSLRGVRTKPSPLLHLNLVAVFILPLCGRSSCRV